MDSDNDFDGESSDSGEDEEEEQEWLHNLARVRVYCCHTTALYGSGEFHSVQAMTDEDWEELGEDISDNRHVTKHLTTLCLHGGALNDQKMSSLFLGLTRSSSITKMILYNNDIGVVGVRSMVPFLQNARNLNRLDLDNNNIQSDGFNELLKALRNSRIEVLTCDNCGIESIEIDKEHAPRHLKQLILRENSINAAGCRELAKLLQGGDSVLKSLYLDNNQIDDEGVEILANTLQKNTSLTSLYLCRNEGISKRGEMILLKLVSDVSSIEATLRSNHTLEYILLNLVSGAYCSTMQKIIDKVIAINRTHENISAGREKVIRTQFDSEFREQIANLQGVHHSVYDEIDPLHLPEVLSLIGKKNGYNELYTALSSSIMSLFSTVSRKKCIKQEMEYHAMKVSEYAAIMAKHTAKLEELSSELGAIEATEGHAGNDDDIEHRSHKRHRNE